GFGRSEANLKLAVVNGVIDRYALSLEEAVAGADMVFIATPTQTAETMLTQLAPLWRDDWVVTDGASVKGNMLRAAQVLFKDVPGNLVLGHPIAGSEQSGVAAADAGLYRDHRVILTPLDNTAPEALAQVREMWQCAGAEVVEMPVAEHDTVLAATSHLPHVLAYALVDALAKEGAAEQIFRFAAGGFRDFTRIASSDPTMWHDIVLANSDAVLTALDQFTDHLAELRSAIAAGDGDGIQSAFERAKQARDRHFLTQYKNTDSTESS
ncbi:MAG: prephenate dehydrogenase/arogenate dehydrogenase family protein, partial [Oceanisphaera sp.]|nr:prephenate dehydrogenase/arogenate dehydrogenase family protein [Oceanisphaera sp.]